jgi:large subunit ribosomal protein L4
MQIPVYSVAGQVIDQVDVDESALGGRPNMDLLRQALLMYEANQRVGTAKSKTRAELSGSNAKPRPQKHTGRSRQGSRKSPIWVGGGSAHGPRPRDYRQKMNRTARRQAVCSAFLAKALDGEILAVDDLRLPRPKTKEMAAILRNVGVERTFLVVLHENDPELWRCTRNLRGGAMMTYRELNPYTLIRPRRVVFTRQAIDAFLRQAAGDHAEGQPAADEVGVSEDG